MTLSFRRATLQDANSIAQIGHISYLHHFQSIWNDFDELKDYVAHEYHLTSILQSLNEENTQWWIIVNSLNEAIGFIKLSLAQTPSEHYPHIQIDALSHGCCLNKVYLLPQYTGQGLGQQIFKFVEQHLQQQTCQYFWLEVLKDNLAAKQFYLRQGMQIIADAEYQYTGQQHQLHIMSKTLNF
ncbi:GNAT family N-acetyltransferase [Acinetobacter rudis]|uniref:GNAT family N-acetyltransferase n=1 Tax=Acinetobacter rudis TaxID=632955 RepID=A0AAW8J5G0_9GAMM|nr:GNAT family N-acetyltransferase [Acinetobacter rudis]MDQ8934409.1 GNAT family N-acetyltransferase [Acinetobacter rudis]MDQ8951896.1 GNAT family N-acetyltransferase [Acinetobacter rudis]MDQ9016691.1 GNAT family N-acetyltransferase [Acinetobacter rudis]